MNEDQLKKIIEAGISDANVKITDTRGSGDHFQALIISPSFKDIPLLEQHQLVYKAVGSHMKKEIHALSIKTYSPEQWETQKNSEV